MKIFEIFENVIINAISWDIKSNDGIVVGIYGATWPDNFTPPPLGTGDIGVTGQ